MNTKKLRDEVRTGYICKDVSHTVNALEDYFREADPEIDLWWFRNRVNELAEMEDIREDYSLLTDLAKTDSIEHLQAVVAEGLLYKEMHLERKDELSEIKKELRQIYLRLIRSLA